MNYIYLFIYFTNFFLRWICILCQLYPNNKVKKKKVFDFHLNSFFLFISSSSQLKILSIYTHSFLEYYFFFYLPYNYLLYSSLLSTIPTTLQVFFYYKKLNIFCVFVAFLLYTIWFLSTSFIDMLKFYVFITDYAENINFCLS